MHLVLFAFVGLWLLLWAFLPGSRLIERLDGERLDGERHRLTLFDDGRVTRALAGE